MVAITPRTESKTVRERVLASLAVEPHARELAEAHGLRLLLHGDHTFQIVDFNFREAEQVRLTMFTDRGEVKEPGRETCYCPGVTIADVLRGFLERNGYAS